MNEIFDFLNNLTWPQAAVCIVAMVLTFAFLRSDP